MYCWGLDDAECYLVIIRMEYDDNHVVTLSMTIALKMGSHDRDCVFCDDGLVGVMASALG